MRTYLMRTCLMHPIRSDDIADRHAWGDFWKLLWTSLIRVLAQQSAKNCHVDMHDRQRKLNLVWDSKVLPFAPPVLSNLRDLRGIECSHVAKFAQLRTPVVLLKVSRLVLIEQAGGRRDGRQIRGSQGQHNNTTRPTCKADNLSFSLPNDAPKSFRA